MERYPNHPVEDLKNDQLDTLLGSEWSFTPESQDRIFNHVQHTLNEPKKHRKRKRIMLAAIAAVMVLLLMGFANFDRIQQLMAQLFGSSQISEYAMTLEESVTDQGFTMTGIAAVKDGDSTYVFVELKDEEGGRLTEDLRSWNSNAEGISKEGSNGMVSMFGIGCNLFSYDAEAETATLLFNLEGDFQADAAQVSLLSFATGEKEVNQAVEIDLYEAAMQSEEQLSQIVIEDGWSVSASEELSDKLDWDNNLDNPSIEGLTRMDIGDLKYTAGNFDLQYVSNIAYADGLLHIQVHTPKYRAGFFSAELRDKNGEMVVSLYETGTGEVDTGYGYIIDEYTEYVYDISDPENLKDMTFGFYGDYYENIYGGDWTIQLAVPEDVESKEISASKQITIDGEEVTVEKTVVTPISITVTLDNVIDNAEALEVSAVLKDGRKVAFPEIGSAYENGDSGQYDCKYTGGVVDLDEVSEIIIGGEVFSLTS